MGAFYRSDRSGLRAMLLLSLLVLPLGLCFPGRAGGQSASAAFARRDAMVQAGLQANHSTLEAVVQYAIALEDIWSDKIEKAGLVGQTQPPGEIPAKEYALNQAVQAGLQELRSSIKQAVQLQGQASTTQDGKLALMLATDAASWTHRALGAAQELRSPVLTYVPNPQGAPIASTPTSPSRPSTPTSPSRPSTPTIPSRPTLESAPGFAKNLGELSKHLDELSNRVPVNPPASTSPPSGGPPRNTAELNRYLDQLNGRTTNTPTAGPGAAPATQPPGTSPPTSPPSAGPPRNMAELSRYLDQLSGRVPAAEPNQPGAAPRSPGDPPRNMVELSRYLDELSGKTASPRLWDPPPAPAQPPGGGSRFATNLTELFQHLDELSGRAALQADPQVIRRGAETEFDQGRAGAGGIALYKAAELLSPLPTGQVKGAAWKEGQLFLRFDDRQIAFPPLDPEYLALAIRCVYGGEGTYQGKLVAEESNAIVVQTGRTRFGEVVWKKQFLSTSWTSVPPGSAVQVELGPGLGLLAEVEPSTDRVTYYGPIQDTRMGKVLLESDQVLIVLHEGIDPKTGRPARPDIDGFLTFPDRIVRKMLAQRSKPAAESTPPSAPSPPPQKQQWWTGATWMVWVPDCFSLRLTADGKQLEFVDTRMKLDTWAAGESGVSEEIAEFGRDVTKHYGDLTRSFPALGDLQEAAKAVCVVRWLKQQKIALDNPVWAKGFAIQKTATPPNVRRFAVDEVFNIEKGLPVPVIEKGAAP